MALTINTNISSLVAQRNLASATSSLNAAIERMTTGYKINHASDNAAGYSIARNWETQLGSLDVAADNAATGADMLTTLEDTYTLLTDHCQRVRDLTEQAANGTYGTQSLNAIKSEITARLQEIFDLGDGNTFVPFTSAELTALGDVIGTIIDDEWFQNYNYALDYNADPFDNGSRGDGTKMTEFYDPQSLKHTMWLHYWGIKSTSPFKQAVVFSKTQPSITSVAVSPAAATVSAGVDVQLSAVVVATGFANKSVVWDVTSVEDSSSQAVTDSGVSVDINGNVHIPATLTTGDEITITATSIFDSTKSNSAVITIA